MKRAKHVWQVLLFIGDLSATGQQTPPLCKCRINMSPIGSLTSCLSSSIHYRSLISSYNSNMAGTIDWRVIQLKMDLLAAFDDLHIPTNRITRGEAHQHFRHLALRHIFATRDDMRYLPYQGSLAYPANDAASWGPLVSSIALSFWKRYKNNLWSGLLLMDREAALENYFKILLQMPAEDVPLVMLLGEGELMMGGA